MKKFLLSAAIGCIASVPASAVSVVGATKVRITSAATSDSWLQISEFRAFNFSNVNVALDTNGGSAVSTSDHGDTDAGKAIDGNTQGNFPNMWHSAFSTPGEHIDISFAAPQTLSSLSIQGRNVSDCCAYRDLYTVTVYGGQAVLYSAQVDARGQIGSISFAAPGVPEPQTWALLVAGFGLVGAAMRRRKSAAATA